MRLEFAEPAEDDLDHIVNYIAEDNPAAAEKVYHAIVAGARRLVEFPLIGRSGRMPGTRELSLPGLPYIIVYVPAADTVTIVAVFHSKRDLAAALQERLGG